MAILLKETKAYKKIDRNIKYDKEIKKEKIDYG